jgi:hypothetical protein
MHLPPVRATSETWKCDRRCGRLSAVAYILFGSMPEGPLTIGGQADRLCNRPCRRDYDES